jgi:hypothetical protein
MCDTFVGLLLIIRKCMVQTAKYRSKYYINTAVKYNCAIVGRNKNKE